MQNQTKGKTQSSLYVYAQFLNHIRLFAHLWAIVLLAPLIHVIFQAEILEWVAIFLLQGIFLPRDWTYISFISCSSQQILYH